jgi:hypothetical protein
MKSVGVSEKLKFGQSTPAFGGDGVLGSLGIGRKLYNVTDAIWNKST